MSVASSPDARYMRCNNSLRPYFPVTKQYPPPAPRLSRKGTLILRNNRIHFRPYLFGLFPFPLLGEYLVIWPHGYSAVVNRESVHIIDDIGKPVARVGHGVEIHGETVLRKKSGALVDRALPADCHAPYWKAHGVSEPALD